MDHSQSVEISDPASDKPARRSLLLQTGYSAQIWSMRFSSPAASAYLPQSLIELLFKAK